MAVSLRAIETEKFKVIDLLSKEVLEEIEESKAFFQVIFTCTKKLITFTDALHLRNRFHT